MKIENEGSIIFMAELTEHQTTPATTLLQHFLQGKQKVVGRNYYQWKCKNKKAKQKAGKTEYLIEKTNLFLLILNYQL